MLYFDYNKELINKVRQLPGIKWSANNKAWHFQGRLFGIFKEPTT
jgi:hypothetical protein